MTDIGYSHHSDYRGGSIGLGQKSTYNGFATYLGLGFGYNRFARPTLTGTVEVSSPTSAMKPTSRRATPTSSSKPEVPLDDYWDQALRYAGEFSGFRLAAEARGPRQLPRRRRHRPPRPHGLRQRQPSRAHRRERHDVQLRTRRRPEIRRPRRKLDISIGVQYGESDTHPVAHRSGKPANHAIEFERKRSSSAPWAPASGSSAKRPEISAHSGHTPPARPLC